MSFSWRAGCRGHPAPPAGWTALVETARSLRGDVLDASACLGVPARAATAADVVVLEPSALGLSALRHDLAAAAADVDARLRVSAGLPWDAPRGSFDHVLLAPPAERGSHRVRSEIHAAAAALRPGGTAWILLEKDRGAKRYEREARASFGEVQVVDRRKGWRLSRATQPRSDVRPQPWSTFETPHGEAAALAGCFAAGKLDPGSALLLERMDAGGAVVGGATVLDLGCGWGPLARHAARRGARVTAVDDDLAAVRSCVQNVPDARVVHGDLDDPLDRDERFERVILNPPFHVGSGVRLGLGRAFLDAARRRVSPGGEIWLVANDALPYEATFSSRETVDVLARAGGFKVLRARPPNVR
ncbi:MAG: methyltransferase [Trueperaceae bacterium]|nr:methyltransferase [Trueperaceae bacterium]